jgi:hypothetical protein
MISPESESDALKAELRARCAQLIRPRVGYEISGTVFVSSPPYGVVIDFDTHLDSLMVSLDIEGEFFNEDVYSDGRGYDVHEVWNLERVRDRVLPILRQHMVLDDLAAT